MSAALDDYLITPTSGYDRPLFLDVGLQGRDVAPTSTLTLYDQSIANHQDVNCTCTPTRTTPGPY